MATYVTVPADAFARALEPRGFTADQQGAEVTYFQDSQRISRLRLVVYTSLSSGASSAREAGADAVRVALVAVGQDGRTRGVRSFTRVNRVGTVEGVLERVRDRIKEARAYALKEIKACSRCGGPAYADSGRCAVRCGETARRPH